MTANFLLGQENWDSKIPLKVVLAKSEITTTDHLPPLYVQGARMGYLHSIAEEALAYFRHVLPPGEDTPWFESNGSPLRWQTPLGVLFDLMTSKEERPWSLTIHYRSYPVSDLLPWTGPHCLRAAYLNSLKEAAYICAGSAASVMSMASSSQEDLWKAVGNNNFGQYFRISESINISTPKHERRRQNVPLRVFIRRGRGGIGQKEEITYTSRPVAALREDSSHRTLGETLESILPEYFDVHSRDNSNIGSTCEWEGGGGPAVADGGQKQAAKPAD